MKIIVLGADGFLGWPTAMNLAVKGHKVLAVDNYSRRTIAMQTQSEALMNNPNLEERVKIFKKASKKTIKVEIGDLADYRFMERIVKKFKPDAIVHFAEQPSGPYSMIGYDEAHYTLRNNLDVTFNVIYAILEHAPNCHLIKLGTMGEYGTPNIDIEEGWLEVTHNKRKHKFLYPRQAGSLYHTTKVLDTDLLWFYVRTFGIRVTDLMQGPVYGLSTPETDLDDRLLPNLHYDDIFGTVVNRFLVQAVAGIPLTVYGKGGQIRGYLNLRDTMQCIALAIDNPANKGELKIYNQLTETFTVNELAKKVQEAGKKVGLKVKIKSIPNPRKETEKHYYNPKYTGLMELGLKPNYMTTDVLVQMLEKIMMFKDNIDEDKILPRVKWNN
ncbi:MAG TPA: NAD-dependent epimerase/dehydratase family protein [Bacteroidetes bacterium]|nr:NAD-dependent epimerase/dehydratase family protein [Bacteroidota bacterium]